MSNVLLIEGTEPAKPTAQLFSLADARAEAKVEPAPKVAPVSSDPAPAIAWTAPSGPDEAAPKEPARPSKWPTLVLCLNVACLTATVSVGAILAASYQPWKTLHAMSEKLGAMEGAETRLRSDIMGAASRLDGVIQLRMDRSDAKQYELLDGLGGLRASVEGATDSLRESDVLMEDRLSEMMMSISDLQTGSIAAPAARRSGPKTVPAVLPAIEDAHASVPAPTRSPGQAQQASARFERREMPDGSVAYRRID